MDRLFVTGGSGFIGSHLHRVASDRLVANLDLVAPDFICESKYVPGDVREPESMDAALRENSCSAIICLAAEHRDFGITKEEYFRTNEWGTKVISDAAAKYGVKKIIFFSSVAVYGNVSAPTTEETPPAPVSHYGASKLAGEAVLREWAAADPERSVVIMRPTVVYGARNRANMLRLILQIDRNRYVNIGEAANVKSIAFVDNIVDATLYLLDNMRPGVQTFNYVDDPQLSVGEISGVIAQALGKRRPLSIPRWAALAAGVPFDFAIAVTGRDLPVSTMRIKKLAATTHHTAAAVRAAGFEPRHTTVNGLKAMVAWYLERKSAGDTPTVLTSSSG